MKEQDSRIAIRLSSKRRRQIEHLVEARKFKNSSHVVRAALTEFLSKFEDEGVENHER
jgi:Arc/MetJ-type ribon-helix-helix transcriptional regulator